MKELEELRESVCDGLAEVKSEIKKKGGILSQGLPEMVESLTHSLKSIDTVLAMEDAGYSHARSSYDGSMSHDGRRRDSMGRYSRDNDGMNATTMGRSYGDGNERAMEAFKRYLNEMGH